MPTSLITTLGKSLIRTAAGDGTAVAISHVALGDGMGTAYEADKNQTQLRRERARVPIERRHALGDDSWRIVAEFSSDTPAFLVREMGFFTAKNELIGITTFPASDARETGVFTFIVDHVLTFNDVASGLVIVEAPDDELFDFAIFMIAEQASQRLHMFQMNERITP